MGGSELHEAEVESRWEAAPPSSLVIVLQVAIAVVSRQQDWTLWRLPWWFWLVLIVPEVILFAALALSWPRRADRAVSDAAARSRWRCSAWSASATRSRCWR